MNAGLQGEAASPEAGSWMGMGLHAGWCTMGGARATKAGEVAFPKVRPA